MSKSYFFKLLLSAITLISINVSFAQTNLATWNFDGNPSATTIPNVTASNLTLSAAINPASTAYPSGVTGQAIAATSFQVTTVNNLNEFFEFSITPGANFTQSLVSITFASFRTGTGPQNWSLRSNVDNYATDLAAGLNPTSFALQTANLGMNIQNRNTTVTFRLYGYGATGSTGNWRIDDLVINGTIVTTLPNITISRPNMSFGTLGQGSLSVPLSYNVTGINLIDNIAINAPTDYTICETPNGVYVSSLSLTPTNGSINVPIYVKESTNDIGSKSGTITHNSGGATQQTLIVSGNIAASLTNFSPISTARAASNNTSVTVQGYITVTNQFGGNQIFIQDGTGGISVFSGSENFSDVYGLQIGDFVQISGSRGSFNSLAQINVPITIQRNGTPPSVQTPITIAANQMAAYEGQLVKILDLPNPPSATFAANTNYIFNTTQIRITSTITPPFSNNLVGTSISTGTSNITGIAGRFNSTFQLLPRFISDIENVNSNPFYGNDLNFGTNATLDLGCWNIEWLGHPTEGPSNNTLQTNYAGTILNTLKLDVVNVNEVSNEALLGQVAATAGSNYAYSCSQEVSNVTLAQDPLSQRVCFIYNTNVLSNVSTTALLLDVKANPASFFPNATLGYPAYPENDPGNFFASGRLPYALTADVTLNGMTKRMMFVGMHAKANTDPTEISYYRRQLDIRVLKDKLDQLYPNTPFVVMGDFNDDIDVSIYNAAFESTYKNFVDDPADYRFLTGQASLTDRKKSTVTFNEMIDHIMISNEMFNAYESNSARVGTPELYIPNYGNSTSDHYPVMARFDIANISLPVNLIDFKAFLSQNKTTELTWTVGEEINLKSYLVEKSADGRTFYAFKQIKADGKNQYRTTDEVSSNGTTYYRLKILDNDESFEFSKIVSVDKKGSNKAFRIYPNPTSQAILMENTEGVTPDQVNIYNVNGQLVKQGFKTQKMDVSDLSNGVYILEGILDNNVVLREKIFKN
jgi:uncharacterized protein YdeI (BOF family)